MAEIPRRDLDDLWEAVGQLVENGAARTDLPSIATIIRILEYHATEEWKATHAPIVIAEVING